MRSSTGELGSTICDGETKVSSTQRESGTNRAPTRSSLGLLDLPAEIRLMIFRSLLVNPQDMDVLQRGSIPRACLNVLRTNRLVHGEEFDVFWRENRFIKFPGNMCFGLKKFPRIRDTIQHVQTRKIYIPDKQGPKISGD